LLSETFWERAIEISVGSLSPTINWKVLAKQEFLLPPKDQQARLAELLWAMDEVIEKNSYLKHSLLNLTKITVLNFLTREAKLYNWPKKQISELASKEKYSCIGGPFGSNLTSKHYVDYEGVPVIRGTNLNGGSTSFNEDDFVYVSEEKCLDLHRNLAFPGDLVITQRGTMGQVALIPQSTKHEKFVISQSQMKLTVDEKQILPKFLFYFFSSKLGQDLIKNSTIATGVPHINLGIFKEFEIPTPPIKDQKGLVRKVDNIQISVDQISQLLSASQSLQKSLINQIF
jgi:type I restriction enzyme S subunit